VQTMTVFLQKTKPFHNKMFRFLLHKAKEKVHTGPVTIQWRELELESQFAYKFQSWCHEEYTLETRDIIRSFIALAVTEWILQVFEPELLSTYLQENRQMQVREKWEEIYPYVQFVFHSDDNDELMPSRKTTRKTRLYQTVFDYLQENRELVLHGFVQFRLKEYWKALLEAVDRGIQEYFQDKEYQEFVELLRYFVSIQETKYQVVHVIHHPSKRFLLYDENDSQINLDQLESVLGIGKQDQRDEDFLVSALITLAPKNINVHSVDLNPSLVDTLKNIFDERLTVCTSCMFCLTNGTSLDLAKPTHYNT